MKKYFQLIIILFLMLVIPTHAFSKEFSTYKLKNGQTVIIKEIHDNPIVAIDTWVNTGSINETEQNSGVAHFLEHMFFKGTTKYPIGKFDEILDSKGAITNAATSKDYTHYYIVLPSKDFDLAMDLHSDMLLNPILPRNELEMERKVILEEIAKGEDNPDNLLYVKMNEGLYKEHPYKRKIIGNKNVIENISREEMMDFYNTWYKPDNMITVVVGDVDTKHVLKTIENDFKTANAKKVKQIKYQNEPLMKKQERNTERIDTKTGYLLIGFHGVKPNQVKESAALDVVATILGDGKSSRLYQSIQENKQLSSMITAGHASSRDDSIFYIKAKFQPQNQKELENEIWKQLDANNWNQISQTEIDKAKKIIKRSILYSRESSSNIANELGYTTIIMKKPDFYESYVNSIDKINAKDIEKVVKKYLTPDKAAISYIMPQSKFNTEATENSRNENIENSTNTPHFEKKVYSTNSNAKLVSEYKNSKKYLLDNGLTLIITQNHANEIISINMISKGGYFQENKKGIGQLTAALLSEGTQKYNAKDISNYLDENGIQFAPQMLPDAFCISLKMTKNELDTSLGFFEEIINNSTFEQKSLDKVRKLKLQKIKMNRDLPSNLAIDEMKFQLWDKTPYQNSSKILESELPKITQNDIKAFYSEIFAPQNTIVSINGNVNEQELINYFSNVFQNKSYKKFNYSDYTKTVYPPTSSRTKNITKNSNQAWVVMAYRTPALENKKDWATLKVIDTILGTGMSSRLFTVLRDQQGLAYAVASTYQSNILQGAFITYIGTNPKTAEQARNGMYEQITKIRQDFVSTKELNDAKKQILGNYIISQETNSEKASTIAGFEASGYGFDFDKSFADIIESVTEQDIIEVANKYFNAPLVTIIVK